MTAPFSGEDLIKRSILSSILGLKIKTPRFNCDVEASCSKSCQPRIITYNQPCSSKAILQEEELSVELAGGAYTDSHQPNYITNYEEFNGDKQTLSEQLAESLFLASPQVQFSPQTAYPGPSPQDIYQEIVCECQHLEQHQGAVFENNFIYDNLPSNHLAEYPALALIESPQINKIYSPPLQNYQNEMASHQMHTQMAESNNICTNCHHAIAPKILHTLQSIGHLERPRTQELQVDEKVEGEVMAFEHLKQTSLASVSFEEFIKLVVVAVKEAGRLSKSAKEKVETPEEILLRKRQQNNEAAARYRRRQREGRMAGESEIAGLLNRNKELRAKIEEMQQQINIIKRGLYLWKCAQKLVGWLGKNSRL